MPSYTKEEKAEIWLDSFGLDYAKKSKLYHLADGPYALAAAFSRLRGRAEEIAGAEACAKMERSLRSSGYLTQLLAGYAEKSIACVSYSSPYYPEALRQIPDPPIVLYCKGDVSLLQTRKFAIVGSRRTLPQVVKQTEKFAAGLARHFTIVTGLAEGGDTAAALGALAVGPVICVLAYGFDHVYPSCNADLLAKAEQKGLAVSEYLPHEEPRGFRFPARNRIIAGLSEGVLVVSAGAKSGTRSTAERAFEYGRDVFAFPYGIGVPSGVGCNALIKEYAKLTDDLVDIAAAFGINLTEAAQEQAALSPSESAVFGAICAGASHAEEIAAKCAMPVSALSVPLTLLQMKGKIVSCGGNRYAKV